jgi:ribose transport system substrate-binding protein
VEMKSKRHALALLTGVFAVALTVAACGGSDDNNTTSSAAAPATSAAAPAATDATSTEAPAASAPDPTSGKDIKLGFVQLFNEPYALQIAAGIKAAADEYGASVTVTGPDSLDPTGAISNFQNVVASGAQGVLAMAYPEELWKRPIETAVGQDVVVGTIDISSEAGGAATHTGAPRQQMGAALADEFAKQLPPDSSGDIIAGLCVPGLAQLTAPIEGFVTQMKTLLPNVKVTQVATAGDPAGNFAAWQRIIAKNPNALGFVGPCDQDVQSLVKVKEQSPNSKWLNGVTSGGENPLSSPSIQAGTLTATVSQRGFVEGYVAAKHMLEKLINKTDTPQGWIDTGFDLMTKDNSEDVATALASPEAAAAYYKGLTDKLILPTVAVIEPSNAQQDQFDTGPRPDHDGANIG